MALGAVVEQRQFLGPRDVLGERLREGSIYRLLADEGDRLFPVDYFADLYTRSSKGRPTVPARVLATVMILQSFEGLSDREACDRLEVDLRWQAACGVDVGVEAFHPTVLVGQRNRLRASGRPRRLFEDTTTTARAAGVLKGRARVLDSTPLFDAVATQDTVTQLRASIRRLLVVLDQQAPPLAARVRDRLGRDDDYSSAGKPPCDWDDPEARDRLVVDLVGDCLAALAALDGVELTGAAVGAVELVALVAGQDVEVGPDGLFRIARGVARDRQISTVDPDARHGHKSKNRRFDGYKAHVSLDPDSELIDNVTVTPANAPDAAAAVDLLEPCAGDDKPVVVGDCAYAGGDTREALEGAGFDVMAKVPAATNRDGRFTKDDFDVDIDAGTVTCPAGHTVVIRPAGGKTSKVNFGAHCGGCPLRDRCTNSSAGRSIAIHRHEKRLQAAKAQQATEQWRAAYRADRPKVERKIAHLTRRWWGGRHARVRSLERVRADFDTRAAAINWARLAVLGLAHGGSGWSVARA
jgi:IS5 family transposase